MKVSKAQVQKRIQTQTINGQIIHYSYASKSQATLSMFKNDRILLFNFNTGMLYYINQPKQLPFKTQVPKQKNDAANMNVSIAKNPSGTQDLQIQFVMKNQKNQNINVQWVFTLDNKNLAQDWLRVIQNFKNKKIQEMMDNQEKKKQQLSKKNQNQNSKVNNAWMHDTLGFGLMQVSKKSQVKPEPKIQPKPQPQVKSPQKKPQQLKKSQLNQGSAKNLQDPAVVKPDVNQGSTVKMTQSKFQKQPQKPPLNESIINIRQANMKQSILIKNPSASNIKNHPTPISKQISESNISGSKFTQNNQLSPQLKRSKQQLDPGMSKITLRDELQSILQRSHLKQSNLQNSYISQQQQSRISTNENKKYNPQNDWNLKFLKKQNQQVLIEFQQYAVKIFNSVLKEDQSSKQSIRIYFKPQSMICVANARTIDAKKLKAQFRNYHFIMESCKDNFIVGVPLACLIQYQGLVALVQSVIPDAAPKVELTHEVMIQIKDLQRYTRVKNNILKKAALYDLTQLYQSKDRPLIYINQLIQYLPVHLEENYRGGFLRPQHILDNVNQFMQGGMAHQANRQDINILHQTLKLIDQNVKMLAKQLSTQSIIFANGIELKNIMHSRGINLKYLPLLYSQVTNKTVKKYIHTFMVSKVAKDYILQRLSQIKASGSKTSAKDIVENIYKHLVQGGSTNSDQIWKQIAIKFKKQYNTAMSNHDISGPFFLSCLIKLLPGVYDLTKLNDKKIFFKDQDILAKGFVADLYPKVKSFHRFTTQLTDKVIFVCKQQKLKQNYTALVLQLKLDSQPIPKSFLISKADQDLKEYLSQFSCPSQFDSKSFSHLKLFQSVGQQPPTSLSLSITLHYLKWCLTKQKLPRFKQTIQDSLRIIDYWFDSNHIYHCDFLQLLADYCQITGTVDQSIKLMKQSIATCLKNGAGINKKTGYRYYALAEKQLMAGRKHDSLQNFTKSKNIMESFTDQTTKYPITLVKLSSLYLNNNDYENCVIYGKKAVERFDQMQNGKSSIPVQKGTYDRYSIKAIEIMTRAYEIQNKKSQLYRIAQLCSVKFNKTSSPQAFQQLVKICLTAVIFKHNQQKCVVFQQLLQKIGLNTQKQVISSQKCLNELMLCAQQYNVMQKFMFKFQSLQRILSDINSRRTLANDSKQFINSVKNIVGIVGEDYVYGLIKQKEFQ